MESGDSSSLAQALSDNNSFYSPFSIERWGKAARPMHLLMLPMNAYLLALFLHSWKALYLFFLNKGEAGMDSEILLRSVPTVFSSPSRHDPGVQASRSNHGFSSPTLGEATLLVGWNAAMPGGLKSSGRWHRLTYNKSTLAFIVSLCLLGLLVEAQLRLRVLI